MPPSAMFYNDILQPYARNGKISWTGLPNPELPLKFIGTNASEKSTDEKASWYNPEQINIIVDIIKSLFEDPRASDPPLRKSDISVMAPWWKQVWMIRKRLRNEGFSAVNVGTVEVRHWVFHDLFF
jgi:superfamily I DNA and/or RNA helicase